MNKESAGSTCVCAHVWTSSTADKSFQFGTTYTYVYPANITVYVKWFPNPYTVKYDGNGSTSGSTSSSSHTYDVEKALTANGFSRTGYSFYGWSKSSSATSATYADEEVVKNLTTTKNATVTLYAVWVDDISPTVSISATPTSWSTGSGSVSVTAYDQGTGLASITLKRYSYLDSTLTTIGTWTYDGTTSTQTVSYTETDEGIYQYLVTVVDKNGNSKTASTSYIYLDHSSPSVSASATSSDWANAITITASATDYLTDTSYSGSGIAKLTITDDSGKVVKTATNSTASKKRA